jgi:hypothetical protein
MSQSDNNSATQKLCRTHLTQTSRCQRNAKQIKRKENAVDNSADSAKTQDSVEQNRTSIELAENSAEQRNRKVNRRQ